MKLICAYPINLDALHDLKGPELLDLCPRSKPEARRTEARRRISRLEDLCSSLLLCMRDGSGDEQLIESGDLAREIEKSFKWRYRLGGNAGIMANVLATLGATPVLNAPALSGRLAGMIHPQVRIPHSGRLTSPQNATRNEDMIHFVLQFAKGEQFAFPEGVIAAPRDNRFIASYDPQNSRMATAPEFDSYCLKEIQSFNGALVSGFHLVEFSDFKEIFDCRIEQITSWKRANQRLYIHAEMGSFQRPEMMKYLLERLPADSVGMNEDELAMLAKPQQMKTWRSIQDAIMDIQDKWSIPRLAVHTRDFIISTSERLFSAEDELRALHKGVRAAGALAATGNLTGKPPKEINPAGQEALNEFQEIGASDLGNGAYKLYGRRLVCMVPSLQPSRTRITVGLGDTATAAIFYHEATALKQES